MFGLHVGIFVVNFYDFINAKYGMSIKLIKTLFLITAVVGLTQLTVQNAVWVFKYFYWLSTVSVGV